MERSVLEMCNNRLLEPSFSESGFFELAPTKPYSFTWCSGFPAFAAVAVACPSRHLVGNTFPVMYADCWLSRREPTFVFAFEASLFAFAYDTPPFAFALLLPR